LITKRIESHIVSIKMNVNAVQDHDTAALVSIRSDAAGNHLAVFAM